MEIKLINNLSNEDYHNGEQYKDFWSSSNLKWYQKSPKEAIFQKLTPDKIDNTGIDFGTILHDFMESKHCEGNKFEYNVFEPPINPTTGKYYGETSDKYKLAKSQVINPISADDNERLNDIWQMILKSDEAYFIQKEILNKGIPEQSIFIEGIHKYKIRKDVDSGIAIFDYKTASKNQFYPVTGLTYNIKRYGYHISASMYQYFEFLRTGIWKPFYLVWIMVDKPYDILIQNISNHCYEVTHSGEILRNSGALIFESLKNQHELCQLTNNWPGVSSQFEEINGVRIFESYSDFNANYNEFEVESNEF